MDPIKQLQAQITDLKAKGNPADKNKIAELEAKLAKLMNPKGNESGDMGLKVQRAQDAASKYCKEIFKDDPKGTKKEEINACTQWQSHQITQCEKLPRPSEEAATSEMRCVNQHTQQSEKPRLKELYNQEIELAKQAEKARANEAKFEEQARKIDEAREALHKYQHCLDNYKPMDSGNKEPKAKDAKAPPPKQN